MGPQTVCKEQEEAHMCPSQGEESPGRASVEDEKKQAESNFLNCEIKT